MEKANKEITVLNNYLNDINFKYEQIETEKDNYETKCNKLLEQITNVDRKRFFFFFVNYLENII